MVEDDDVTYDEHSGFLDGLETYVSSFVKGVSESKIARNCQEGAQHMMDVIDRIPEMIESRINHFSESSKESDIEGTGSEERVSILNLTR